MIFIIIDDNPIFTKSRFGNPVILLGRHRYNQCAGRKGPRTRWNCVKTGYGCRAAITTIYDEIIKVYSEHNH